MPSFLTYSMEQGPAWEATRFSASQEIPRNFETQRILTLFTSARHVFLSCAFLINFNWLYRKSSGPGSSVGIATDYGLDGPGSNSGGDGIFRTCPDRPWGPPSLL